MRKTAMMLATVVFLFVAPARVSAQNPTYCYGGWTEQTGNDGWLVIFLLMAAFPELLMGAL